MQTLRPLTESPIKSRPPSPAPALTQRHHDMFDELVGQYFFGCKPSKRRMLLQLLGAHAQRAHERDGKRFNQGGVVRDEQADGLVRALYRLIASDADAPFIMLFGLCKQGREDALLSVAESSDTVATALLFLSWHSSSEVRMAVAENHRTPLTVLWKLAADDSPDVRYRLAENPNTPVAILDFLQADDNPYVAHRAARTLERLSALRHGRSAVREAD